LLERAELTAVDAVGRLAGLQAQDSTGPYFSLWSRLRDFRREELTEAVTERRVLVATLMRVTIHMVTADAHAWLQPTLSPLHERQRRLPVITGLDHEAFLAVVRGRLPARMIELRRLAPAEVNPGHLAGYLQSNLPLVRVPPAGTWRVGGSPVQELVEVGDPDPERLVLAYLRAFGPATPADAQTWSGLTRLGPVFARLDLERLEGEDGKTYYDVPGSPRPSAATAAPVRFLPRWDNLFIGHADRRRVIPEGKRVMDVVGQNIVLVDGLAAGTWEWADGDVRVTPYGRLPREAEAERRRLRDWLA
jgi:DNA glycosylase AlkZ-like